MTHAQQELINTLKVCGTFSGGNPLFTEAAESIESLIFEVEELKSTIEKLETKISNLTPVEPDKYER